MVRRYRRKEVSTPSCSLKIINNSQRNQISNKKGCGTTVHIAGRANNSPAINGDYAFTTMDSYAHPNYATSDGWHIYYDITTTIWEIVDSSDTVQATCVDTAAISPDLATAGSWKVNDGSNTFVQDSAVTAQCGCKLCVCDYYYFSFGWSE